MKNYLKSHPLGILCILSVIIYAIFRTKVIELSALTICLYTVLHSILHVIMEAKNNGRH